MSFGMPNKEPDFFILKGSNNFWGIYISIYNRDTRDYERKIITSAETKRKAYKKLKLLNIGYRHGYERGYDDGYS